MITVVSYKKYTGPSINIMRPGVFGNPFPVTKDLPREASIAAYKEWLLAQIESKTGVYEDLLWLKAMAESGDIIIKCCCAPLACHGDVIKEWLEHEIYSDQS